MVQIVQAEGPISRPYFQLARLWASLDRWRTICGGEAEALARVYYPEASDVPEDDDTITNLPTNHRPRAIIEDGESWEAKSDGSGGVPFYSSTLLLSVEIPLFLRSEFWPVSFWPSGFWPADFWPSFEVGRRDQKTTLTNHLGMLFKELFEKTGQSPQDGDADDPLGLCHLNIVRVRQVLKPVIVDPTQYAGNYFGQAVYSVEISS